MSTSTEGEVWGQLCGIPENALPRYQTALDRKNPAPVSEEIASLNAEYSRKKRERAEASEDFVDLSEHFGNLPKASESCGTFQDISAGEDVVEEEILSSPLPPDSAISGSAKTAMDEEAKAVVRHVFTYFLEQTGRSEVQYELTDKRVQVGIRAYRVCLRRCGRDPEKAQLAMAAAVDGLIANDWNMGRTPTSKERFTDWTNHVFGSAETIEERWQDAGFKPAGPQVC